MEDFFKFCALLRMSKIYKAEVFYQDKRFVEKIRRFMIRENMWWTRYRLSPIAYGCKVEYEEFNIPRVSTHRSKPIQGGVLEPK